MLSKTMEEGWWSRITRVFRSVFREEVKTPLSFFFRAALLVPLVLAAVLLTTGTTEFKFKVLVLVFGFLLLLCIVVAAMAWWKPKNLVYGESGHRAELKFDYGSDRRTLTRLEVQTLEGSPPPEELAEPAKQLPGDRSN